jgi:DNA-binding transcriptional LysR family regulator
VLVCAPSNPLARGREVTVDAVASLARPLLVMQWWLELPRDVARLAERARPAVDVPMDTGRYMVLRGTGAGIFPWLQVAEAISAGHLVELSITDQQSLVRDSALVRRVGSPPLGRAAQDLVGEIVRRAEQMEVLMNP